MSQLPDFTFCYDHAACGLVITDIDGTIRRANATFAKWLGFQQSELVDAKKIQELFTVGGRFFHHTHWAPLLQMQGSVSEVQIDLRSRDDKIIPMLVNASRISHDGTIIDQMAFFIVDDRKKFEQELVAARKKLEASFDSLRETQNQLQRNQNMLNLAMHSAKMAGWSFNVESERVEWNNELQSLLGFDEDSGWLSKESFYNLLHPEDKDSFRQQLRHAIKSQTNYTLECRLKNSQEHWVEMEISGYAVITQHGETQSIYGICMDVSERKARLRELAALNTKLSSSDHRKNEFLATLSHELRNPLAPIRNVLEIMRIKENDATVWKKSRILIDRHVSHMSRLIEDLMDISRISHNRINLRKQAIDILPALHCAVDETKPLIDAQSHQLSINEAKAPIYVNADSTRIVQIFSNLLTNAAKYTPAGGTIDITVSQNREQVTVSVEDSGIGIPAEELENIFTMFSQLSPALERAQGGLGIGLALVHHLVTLHEGEIEVSSEGHNKGCKFTVKLPVIRRVGALDANSLQDEKSKAIKLPQRRILVIEDNQDTAQSLAELLEYAGHITCTAFDGTSGIMQAKEFKPEVILSDIGLPDISGYEVAETVRKQLAHANIYLIAITGWGQKKDKQLAKASGFNRHITKPVDFAELKQILAELPDD
ncbi:PAS domain-containing hybrid sensor histidine kinase/response regulator [Alteromonas ponticola]|uniref:histidine kinase n=1 Tax=Alteromonas ponticola TaxID=2720613 RepID=A0ABX1R578_9ALTE|nr:ATP-binding protein [Alteromonas ponticola]NMH60908.1 response regulator [Alteromonas ponticola]